MEYNHVHRRFAAASRNKVTLHKKGSDYSFHEKSCVHTNITGTFYIRISVLSIKKHEYDQTYSRTYHRINSYIKCAANIFMRKVSVTTNLMGTF